MTTTTAPATRSDLHAATLDGMEAGTRDLAKCNEPSDVAWLRRVAHDALPETAYWNAYAKGYDHVLAGGVA